jgi:hypothetical protein
VAAQRGVDFVDRAQTADYAHDRGMGERKLKRGRPHLDTGVAKDIIKTLRAGTDFRRRGRVIVGIAGTGGTTEQSGVVGSRHQYSHVVRTGAGHDLAAGVLLEQGVAAREHDRVEGKPRHDVETHGLFVHAQADCADHAFIAHARHFGQGFVQRLGQHTRMVGAMGEGADIVQEQDVDVVGAETTQARVEATTEAVAAVIEAGTPSAHGKAVGHAVASVVVFDHPAELGRQGVAVTRHPGQRLADARLAQPETVVRGRIEVPDAAFPRMPQGSRRLLVGHLRKEVTHRCATEGEGRERFSQGHRGSRTI